MTKITDKKRRIKITIFVLMIIVVLVSIILETIILDIINTKNEDRVTTVLVDQVVSTLENGEENVVEMVPYLKKEYLSKAKTVAYILRKNSRLVTNQAELEKIASLLEVDEIHIFDKQGTIFAGTVPKYYGINVDDGEQISFFRPMLEDKDMALCQDVTPNSAENKNMMYAMVWNDNGSNMVQIGVEPLRLLEQMQKNQVDMIAGSIPTYKGLDIYIADYASGEILGTSDANKIGKYLYEMGIPNGELEFLPYYSENVVVDGVKTYCKAKRFNDYLVLATYSSAANLDTFIFTILAVFAYALIAGIIVLLVINKLIKAYDEKDKQFAVLTSMSEIYYSTHLIDLENNVASEYNARNEVKDLFNDKTDADEIMYQIMSAVTDDEYREEALEFTDITTLAERMKDKKLISAELLGKHIGWFVASFIVISRDEEGKPVKVVYTTRSIDDEKKKEEKLIHKSNTDELTGLFNRRAYEDDIEEFGYSELDDDLVYFSFDVNELKVVNDTLGHAAGDELLVGASLCMQKCFGPYGKLYRMGGDEFVAIITANEHQLGKLLSGFDNSVEKWSGNLVEKMTVSYGLVTRQEAKTKSIREIAILAEKKMYDAKSKFYQKSGTDRRGQKDAHVALCSLYTKILKINITDDTYQIVNMDEREQTTERGFSDKISAWLSDFGTKGQVHPEDLKEYLSKTNTDFMRDYFRQNNESLTVFYRRKYGDIYKRTMMEIIPASDYDKDNQNLFLYVKNIDK